MYELRDNWTATGNDLESFRRAVDEVVEKTEFMEVEAEHLKLYSFIDEKPYKENFLVRFWKLSDPAISNLDKFGVLTENPEADPELAQKTPLSPYRTKDRITYIVKHDGNKELVEEMEIHTGLVALYNSEVYMTSPSFRMGLARWGKAGEGVQDDISLSSNITLAKLFKKTKRKYTMVSRFVEEMKESGPAVHKKFFGLLSDKYTGIGSKVLYKAIDLLIADKSLGEVEIKKWTITQDFTEIFCEFPEAADNFTAAYSLPKRLVPGLRLATSDTGFSSVVIEPTYRIEGHMAIGEEVRRVHKGAVTEKDILEDVKTDILTKMSNFPEKLCERMAVTIGNEDLTTKAGQKENKRLVSRAISAGLKELKLRRILGQNRSKILTEKLRAEIRADIRYTEFDIAVILMNIPDRVFIGNAEVTRRLAKACGRAAELPYFDLSQKVADKDDIFIAEEE